ncbi:hypothetical protein PSCICO_46850 [Pseudomonas cichorii]|uniref:DUF6602 domain-containing protein n=1 Tax=Pseudomonas cichorii TaxID=36746 RepID=UPI00191066E6|nr:DUF6602 domain-containing protein [Pseudomonas cichorii]GFM89286.1 hypothetical protein PSCICO_46850 [Pseudomonas cichorii]
MSDLMKLLQLESEELSNKFAKASIEGRGTPQEVADRREAAVHALIAKYFPFPFRIAKGNIIDSFGGRSASIDCVVLNPEHPHTVSDGNHFSVLLADGTDHAIEIKPDLTSRDEIERALKQIASVKKLKRLHVGKPNTPSETTINGIIFSNTTYIDLNLLLNSITEYYTANRIKRVHQFDLLVVNKRCVIVNCRHGHNLHPLHGAPEGMLILQSGLNTFAAAIFMMNQLPLSRIRLDESVIVGYIVKEDLGIMEWSVPVNEALTALESLDTQE